MNQFFSTRLFQAGQLIKAKCQLVDNSGAVYLHEGESARVMMCDPEKYPDRPYGLRKDEEHITRNFFAEDQLMEHPDHPRRRDAWTARPAERFSHPGHPRHEELRASNWEIDPATV